eukprot:scaffold184_cov179-Amphora_coffeaeformis.AAC.3
MCRDTSDESFSAEEERIPVALQAVFLASNRGKEVNEPPPGCIASKSFKPKSLWKRLSPRRKVKSILISSGNFPPPPPLEAPSSPKHEISPFAYLGSTVLSRGYSNKTFSSLETAYFNDPTAYQRASFGRHFAEAVRFGNIHALRKCLLAGLSPNASNAHGESVLHMACRSNQAACFRLLMAFGAEVQVCDSNGRTILHEACWCEDPSFEIIEAILDVDTRMLFLTDSRGSTPLEYVRRENWTRFTKFLMTKKDKYWPDRDFTSLGPEKDPEITLDGPHSRPIENLRPDLSLASITAMAEGIFSRCHLLDSGKSYKSIEDGYTDSSEYSDSEDLDCTDSEVDRIDNAGDTDDECEEEEDNNNDEDDCSVTSLDSFDEDEMKQILASIGRSMPVRWCK